MGYFSTIWNALLGKITGTAPRDPDCYYIDYTILARAVGLMPNPLDIAVGHEETAYKWYKLAQWVGRTVTHTPEEKPIFGQMGESIHAIYRAIQQQAGSPIVEIAKYDLDYIQENAPYLLETMTFYERKKQALEDPKIVYLRPAAKAFSDHSAIPIPAFNEHYPDRSLYIRHFYQTITNEIKMAPAPRPQL